jgi:hypothetical protein
MYAVSGERYAVSGKTYAVNGTRYAASGNLLATYAVSGNTALN